MTKPTSKLATPLPGDAGKSPVRHPKFDAATRRELVRLVGDAKAANRIEADCAHFDAVARGQTTIDSSSVREKARGVAEASELLLRRLMALDLEGTLWPTLLCTRPTYTDTFLHRPWILATGDSAWADLFTHVDAIAASAREIETLFPAKKGRPQEHGLSFVGRNLITSLEQEGLRRSYADKSPMVRAVAVVFAALDFKADAREFVRSVIAASKGK